MKYNSRSIYGCTMAEPEFEAPRGCRLTQSLDGKRLYIHLVEYPLGFVEMKKLDGKVEYAQFLHDYSQIETVSFGSRNGEHADLVLAMRENSLAFKVPAVKPNVITPVIEVFLK